MAAGIARSRILSRAASISQVGVELEQIGVEAVRPKTLVANVKRDISRAERYSKSYAQRWFKKADAAENATLGEAIAHANTETAGSLKRIAVSESAEAFADGKAVAIDALPRYEYGGGVRHPETKTQLLKVWDATLDKHTCWTCEQADGTIVCINERFPQGTPGAIHPWDRCTWSVLRFEERGDQGLIVPQPPAKVISFPSSPK